MPIRNKIIANHTNCHSEPLCHPESLCHPEPLCHPERSEGSHSDSGDPSLRSG